MSIRFKCPHCKKALAVKDELAGRRGACPACKKAVVIPTPAPAAAAVDVEALAAAALADEPQQKAEPTGQPIKFTCSFCDEESEFPADLAGKKAPCPSCKRIVKVPEPKVEKPKDWRELIKKGPSAALINQPEQLEGAWGAEVKTKVSGAALEEAGAIVEEVEPVGVLGWAKRGLYTALIIGVAVGGFLFFSRKQSLDRQEDYVKLALKSSKELPPLLAGEVYLGAGIIQLRDNKAEVARRSFDTSLAYLRSDTSEDSLDFDLALIELAQAQCELGGGKEQILSNERFDWLRDVQPDLETSLGAIRGAEAKVWAARAVGTRLLAKNQGAIAVSLATGLANTTTGEGNLSPILAPQVGLLLARNDAKAAEKQLKPPDDVKGNKDPRARLLACCGYADGYMRQGKFEDAKKLVLGEGPDRDRFEACLAAAAISLDDSKRKSETEFFFQEAYKLYGSMKQRPTPWQIYQLANLGLAAGATEETKELVKALSPNHRSRWQVEKVRWELAKASGLVAPNLLEEVTDDKSPHRRLAWAALARHQARLGYGADVLRAAEELNDAAAKTMVHIGLALGEQDRHK